MKRGALPRYHTGGLVTVLLSLRVYSDLIWSLRHGTWVETTWLWCCGTFPVRHLHGVFTTFMLLLLS